MSQLGEWFFQKERDTIRAMLDKRLPYAADVFSAVAAGVRIVNPLSFENEDEVLAPVGFRPSAGQRVIVLTLSDGSRVVLPLGQDGTITRTGIVRIETDNTLALSVRAADGTNRVVVDTVTPQLELWNSTKLVLLSGNGSPTTGRWDAVTGTIDIGNILSEDIRGVYMNVDTDATPTTATNNSVTTYVEAGSFSFTLPAGTWAVKALAFANFKNNTAAQGAQVYIDIDGSVSSSVADTNAAANEIFTLVPSHSVTGKTGTIAVKTMYRASGGGTVTARQTSVAILAARTGV